jgi:RNA polymerase sigma factor (sigma-70 family)
MMARAPASPILQLIRRIVEDPQIRELPDRELLVRFHSRHDDAAFRSLLRRHGSMVLDVCRGVLGDGPDAEDAFQATFLVLGQKGGSIREAASLGSWLHGVALRTALKTRARSAARQKHEARTPQRQASEGDDLSWREVRQVLHEELAAIPECYREALLLCYLAGATQRMAAARMGLAERTLRERLERGRALLRERLVRRGLGPSAPLVVAAWPAAAVPAALVDSTVKVATGLALSANVAAFVQGVLRTMVFTKSKVTLAGLLSLLVLVGGLSALRQDSFAQLPPRKPPEKGKAGPPTWKVGATLYQHTDRLWEVAYSPDGKRLASSGGDKAVLVWDTVKGKMVHTLAHAGHVNSVVFTPDGKTLITASGSPAEDPLIQFWDLATGKERATLKGLPSLVHGLTLSGGGKVLVSTNSSVDMRFEDRTGAVVFWDLETRKKIASVPCDRVYSAILSRGGKKMVTVESGKQTVALWGVDSKYKATESKVLEQGAVKALRASPDGKTFVTVPMFVDSPSIDHWEFEGEKVLHSFVHKDVTVHAVAFSPDGKTLATGCFKKIENGGDKEVAGEVRFWDVATGREKQALTDKFGPVRSLAFSPDGKTLAVGLHHKDNIKLKNDGGWQEPAGGYAGAVIVCELKGRGP